jgi:peptide chain release factor 2
LNAWQTARNALKIYWCVFDYPALENEFTELIKKSEEQNLWDNPDNAQKTMKRLARVRQRVEGWERLKKKTDDALELAELGDESLRKELESEVKAIEAEVSRREFNAMLSGQYDRGDAIFAIHAGAGGTDSQDWVEMLLRMYLRWMEQHSYETEIIDTTPGEEAGIKSVTVAVSGRYAYGYLRAEKGVHRLVRLSPFDSANRRHTSFAMVEVLPQVDDEIEIDLNPNDLRIDTFRSAGAGGQNVQKNDTAVRITHIPTGVVATCQNERSQTQNREMALKVLKARLLEIKEREHAEKLADLRGEYVKAEWGSQIRSYVLHPYQMVKDHRTNYETGNTTAVLDGNLDGFIEAYLKANVGE